VSDPKTSTTSQWTPSGRLVVAAAGPTGIAPTGPASSSTTGRLGYRGSKDGSYRQKDAMRSSNSPLASPVHAPVVVAATGGSLALGSALSAAAAAQLDSLADEGRTVAPGGGMMLVDRYSAVSVSDTDTSSTRPSTSDAAAPIERPLSSSGRHRQPIGAAAALPKSVPIGMPPLRLIPVDAPAGSPEARENHSAVARMAANYWRRQSPRKGAIRPAACRPAATAEHTGVSISPASAGG